MKKNKFRIEDEIVYIEIISKGVTHEMLIDKEDFKRVSELGLKISLSGKGYARFTRNKKNVSLHRFILNTPDDKIVDHINTNKLDNRKINLRNTTYKGNNNNLNNKRELGASGIRGVKRNPGKRKLWQVVIRNVYYGSYDTLEEAGLVSGKVEAWLRECERKVYYREVNKNIKS